MIGDKRAVMPLIRSLKNDDEIFKECVVFALGNIKDKRAVGPLIDALVLHSEKYIYSSSEPLEGDMSEADMQRMVDEGKISCCTEAEFYRIPEALEAIGTPKALDALEKFFMDRKGK